MYVRTLGCGGPLRPVDCAALAEGIPAALAPARLAELGHKVAAVDRAVAGAARARHELGDGVLGTADHDEDLHAVVAGRQPAVAVKQRSMGVCRTSSGLESGRSGRLRRAGREVWPCVPVGQSECWEAGRSPCLRADCRHGQPRIDPAFLASSDGPELSPPSDLAEGDLEPGAVSNALDYTHFTVRMHPVRRLAWWVAWNVDGLTLFPSDSISRSGERFKLDSRLPAVAQTGEEVYADNDLDRGHLARRSDLLWGATLAEALDANSDSFYFTNISPQRAGFNQSGRGGVWGLLENAVLALDGLEDRRLSVFAGPVLGADDPTYRDVVQLPREF